MSTGLTLWTLFFALWLFALHRATHRAFTQERDRLPGIPFEQGPLSAATIVFHVGLSTVLLVCMLASVYEDAQMLLFGIPGVLAPIVQGVVLRLEHNRAGGPGTRLISPYWIADQWPFALLGLSVGFAGTAWWALADSSYPLLLVAFSAFFLVAFWYYYRQQNVLSIGPAALTYVRSFPRVRTFTHRRPRSQDLTLRTRRRRSGVYDLTIAEIGQAPIELTATFSSRERLQLELEEYFIRTDQA